MPALTFLDGRSIDLSSAQELTIGRDDTQCEIAIPDSSVSGKHAKVSTMQNGKLSITDVGSTNGTFLNGDKLPPNQSFFLEDGDEVTFGSFKTKFSAQSSGQAAQPIVSEPNLTQTAQSYSQASTTNSQTGLYEPSVVAEKKYETDLLDQARDRPVFRSGKFEIKRSLLLAFGQVRRNLLACIVIGSICICIPAILDVINPIFVTPSVAKEKTFGALIFIVLSKSISWLWTFIFGALLYNASMKLSSGENLSFSNSVIRNIKTYFFFLLTISTYGVLTFIGYFLLIIPGVILTFKLFYAPYIVIYKDVSPIAAMKESWKVTTGHTLNLFFMGLVAGVIAFVIGFANQILSTAVISIFDLINVWLGIILGMFLFIVISGVSTIFFLTAYANAYQEIRKD